MVRPRFNQASSARRIAPLDPCTLGRPFHLLDELLQRLRAALEQHLQLRFSRRSNARFQLPVIGIAAFKPGSEGGPWQGYRDGTGELAVRMDRALLLGMLGCHYGDPDDAGTAIDSAETETEQRFASALHLQFLDSLAQCSGGRVGQFNADAAVQPRPGQRLIRIEVVEQTRQLRGCIELALDEAWLAQLFHHVVPARPPSPASSDADLPLQRRLPVTLRAQIASRQMPFEDLLQLALGDVLPIRPLGSVEVLVDEVALYRASVAEHGGMLCLTRFEPVE